MVKVDIHNVSLHRSTRNKKRGRKKKIPVLKEKHPKGGMRKPKSLKESKSLKNDHPPEVAPFEKEFKSSSTVSNINSNNLNFFCSYNNSTTYHKLRRCWTKKSLFNQVFHLMKLKCYLWRRMLDPWNVSSDVVWSLLCTNYNH